MPLIQANPLKPSLIPFAALSAAYFAHIGTVNTFLALWLKDLGYGVALIGLLTSIQAFTRVTAPYAWAWLGDKTGRRAFLLRIATVLALISSLGMWWDLRQTHWGTAWLTLVLLLMYLNTSALMTMSESALSQIVSKGGVFDATRYGRVRLWGSVGFLITVLIVGSWFERFGMEHLPYVASLTLLILVFSAFAVPEIKESKTEQEHLPPVWQTLKKPQVAGFFITLFLHVLAHMSIYVFFSLYCDDLGYSKTMIAVFWAVAVVMEIIWFFTQGRWLPRLSLSAWLMLCAAAGVLRFVLMGSFGDIAWVMIAAQALHAISFAAHHMSCTALISHHFPGKLRGRGQALYTVIGYGLAGMVGAWAGGFLSESMGLRSLYFYAALISVVALLSSYWVWRMHHPKDQEEL